MSTIFSHCPTCGQSYDTAGRCGCWLTYGAARGLEEIATRLRRIDRRLTAQDAPQPSKD